MGEWLLARKGRGCWPRGMSLSWKQEVTSYSGALGETWFGKIRLPAGVQGPAGDLG